MLFDMRGSVLMKFLIVGLGKLADFACYKLDQFASHVIEISFKIIIDLFGENALT